MDNRPQHGWTNAVRDLCRHLEKNQQRVQLLREIDGRILDVAEPIKPLVEFVLAQTKGVLDVNRIHLYLLEEHKLQLASSTAGEKAPGEISSPVLLAQLSDADGKSRKTEPWAIRVENDGTFPVEEFACEAICCAPIWKESHRIHGLLLLESGSPLEMDPFGDQDYISYVEAVAGQLAVAFRHKAQQEIGRFQSDVLMPFFQEGLKPSRCIQILAKHVVSYVSANSFHSLPNDLHVQILLKEESDDVLVIRGSTEEEDIGSRVYIRKSVSGRLFEEPELDYLYGNPQVDLKPWYRNYVGHRIQASIQSELVIPVEVPDERFGVINLESAELDALRYTIPQFREFARRVAPVLFALRARLLGTKSQRRAVENSVDNYIAMVGGQYLHRITAPLSSMSVGLDTIVEKAAKQGVDLKEDTERFRQSCVDLFELNENYVENITGFSQFEYWQVGTLLDDAVSLNKLHEWREKRNIEIEIHKTTNCYVHTSMFIREVFRNLIDNSRYWIERRQRDDPSHAGRLTISVEEEEAPPSDQDIELNRYCVFTFRDNGMGCDEETRKKIFDLRFTKRKKDGGSGFGLYFAKEYITGMGGRIKAISVLGEFFEVQIHLNIEDPSENENE